MKKKDLAVLEVLPNPEIQQQVRQPDYQIFEFENCTLVKFVYYYKSVHIIHSYMIT